MSQKNYDVVVVGAGPGGYVAAIRASQLGLKTALVERDERLGGTCLLRGCIPTKAMLHAADLLTEIRAAKRSGIKVGDVEVDYAGVLKAKEQAVTKNSKGVDYLMKKNGIDVIEGHARLSGKCRMTVETDGGARAYRADHIILATGARPRELPGIAIDGDRVWSYFEAMVPERLPDSLLVVGSGAIGVEFASLYNDLGTDVTLVEIRDQILPEEDGEIARFARRSFEKRNIRIHSETQVEEVVRNDSRLDCRLKGPGIDETVSVERLILAVGVRGNIDHLGLEELGVEYVLSGRTNGAVPTSSVCTPSVT